MRMEECILGERVVEGDTLRKTGIKIAKFITIRTNGSCIFFLMKCLHCLKGVYYKLEQQYHMKGAYCNLKQ